MPPDPLTPDPRARSCPPHRSEAPWAPRGQREGRCGGGLRGRQPHSSIAFITPCQRASSRQPACLPCHGPSPPSLREAARPGGSPLTPPHSLLSLETILTANIFEHLLCACTFHARTHYSSQPPLEAGSVIQSHTCLTTHTADRQSKSGGEWLPAEPRPLPVQPGPRATFLLFSPFAPTFPAPSLVFRGQLCYSYVFSGSTQTL